MLRKVILIGNVWMSANWNWGGLFLKNYESVPHKGHHKKYFN